MADNNLIRYSVRSPLMRKQRRLATRRFKTFTAILGDENGVVSSVNDKIGTYRIRFDAGSDGNGNSTKTPYTLAHVSPNANFLPDAGRRVVIGRDNRNGNRLTILGADASDLENAGIDTRAMNPSRRENNFVRLRDVTRLMSRPVGTLNTPSLLANVQPAIFDFYNERVVYRGTELQADKIDFTSLIPSVGNWCIAVVWVSLLDQTVSVSASTAQTISTPIDATDFSEAFIDRPFEAVPIQAYLLSNAQVSIDTSALYEDLRQFINTPDRVGFPSHIQYREHVRTDYRVLTFGTITTDKTLNIEGTVTTL